MKKAANGAGTINRHKRGGWQGRLSAGKRLDGSPKRITVYGATQAIVQAKMQALRDRIAGARRPPAARPPPTGAGYTASRKGALEIKGLTRLEPVTISNLKNPRAAYAVNSGKFANGDSGGGVFENSSLVSVFSHGEDDKRALGATHPQIVSFLKENGAVESAGSVMMSSKSVPPAQESRKDFSDWGDKDRTREILELWKAVRSREPGVAGPAGEAGPAGKDADASEIAKIRQEVAEQRKLIDEVRSTPVTVQVLDPETKAVIAEKKYPFGTPIKLILPTTKARAMR